MKGKVALEEHFGIPETLSGSRSFFTLGESFSPAIKEGLAEVNQYRIEKMDEAGIEVSIISLNSPAIQMILSKDKAIETAKLANDTLAEACAKHKGRFVGFAALPMQDPEAATEELHRCVKDYGFVGALVNGYSQLDDEDNSLYYDLPQYWDFWGEIEKLGTPFYIHPRSPLFSQRKAYEGHPWLAAAAWGFSVETGTHALRLMGSGLFDKYPGINIILGHLGELLPINIWRTDHRIRLIPRGCPAKRLFSDYLVNNFYVTTSGNFRLAPLIAALMEMGSDRILFSTDYPFETMIEASEWFDNVQIGEADRLKIGRSNAIELFKLK